jgi:hypothetical protein
MSEGKATFRVYWWVKGVSADRHAGPWWFRDFHDRYAARRFVFDMKPFCVTLRVAVFYDYPPPPQTSLNIRPPDDSLHPDHEDAWGGK